MQTNALGEFKTFEEMLISAKNIEAQLHNEFWGQKNYYSDFQRKILDQALQHSISLTLMLDMLIHPEFHFEKGK